MTAPPPRRPWWWKKRWWVAVLLWPVYPLSQGPVVYGQVRGWWFPPDPVYGVGVYRAVGVYRPIAWVAYKYPDSPPTRVLSDYLGWWQSLAARHSAEAHQRILDELDEAIIRNHWTPPEADP